MERKKTLIRLLNYSRACLQEFADSIPETEHNLVGEPDRWTAKDQLAHIAHWQADFNHRLAQREKQPPQATDVDKENLKVFHQYRDKSWLEIRKLLDDTFQEFSRDLRLLSEEELLSSTIMPTISNRALWRSIVGSGIIHCLSHLGIVYSERGDKNKTIEIEETILEDMQSLDEDPKWQGTNIYNLACAYALAGFSDKAVEKLKIALEMNPDLTEWSSHDTDLDSIRNMPEYISLYPETKTISNA